MKIYADLHTHTVSSGHAYSTISENALAASQKGILMIGMTDHGPSMPGTPHLYHFGNLSVIPEQLHGVRILKGVEANITSSEGYLDIPVPYLERMELVLVGLHVICYRGGTVEENTRAYIAAMHNPYTDIMVHPERGDFELDFERVAHHAAQLNVAVEMNNSSLHINPDKALANCRLFAKYAARYRCLIALGSDAHFWDRVGDLELTLEVIREAGIPQENVLNTDPNKVLDYLNFRRMLRKKR